MDALGTLALYSALIAVGALAGAWLPLLSSGENPLTGFLSFAAGVMLGAAFFHMLPEAVHSGGYSAFSWTPVGFVFLFLLERYVLVHACEEPPDCAEHAHRSSRGLTAFWGLSVHTLFDGVALGSSVTEGVGLMAFVAILAHKVPSSFSLASILRTEKRTKGSILWLVTLFGLMVAVGAALYLALNSILKFELVAPRALAFSAGTFLYIAVSDLLPHVNRHGKEHRLRNIGGLGAGLAMMFALTFLTGHSH
jgi:zinc and cadmium transporter